MHKQALIDRLIGMGIECSLIPGFIRLLLNCLHMAPEMNIGQVNKHLRYLGWDDSELDYHTLQLAKAYFEEEGFDRLKYVPCALPS